MNRVLVVRPPGPEGRFEKQWKWDPTRRRLENAVFGVAYQVIDLVDEETGVVHHEAVALLSRRAELHVVVREDLQLGFVLHRRSAVIPPEVAQQLFREDPESIPNLFALPVGIEEHECAHGLACRPLEEAREEIGLAVLEAVQIGFVKESPPLGGIAHELFAVKVGTQPSGESPEDGEQIRRVDFFPPEEVRNLKTICGITQAALWRFRVWGLAREPGDFWYEVARRL